MGKSLPADEPTVPLVAHLRTWNRRRRRANAGTNTWTELSA